MNTYLLNRVREIFSQYSPSTIIEVVGENRLTISNPSSPFILTVKDLHHKIEVVSTGQYIPMANNNNIKVFAQNWEQLCNINPYWHNILSIEKNNSKTKSNMFWEEFLLIINDELEFVDVLKRVGFYISITYRFNDVVFTLTSQTIMHGRINIFGVDMYANGVPHTTSELVEYFFPTSIIRNMKLGQFV
jgi:hypothetical protein